MMTRATTWPPHTMTDLFWWHRFNKPLTKCGPMDFHILFQNNGCQLVVGGGEYTITLSPDLRKVCNSYGQWSANTKRHGDHFIFRTTVNQVTKRRINQGRFLIWLQTLLRKRIVSWHCSLMFCNHCCSPTNLSVDKRTFSRNSYLRQNDAKF